MYAGSGAVFAPSEGKDLLHRRPLGDFSLVVGLRVERSRLKGLGPKAYRG